MLARSGVVLTLLAQLTGYYGGSFDGTELRRDLLTVPLGMLLVFTRTNEQLQTAWSPRVEKLLSKSISWFEASETERDKVTVEEGGKQSPPILIRPPQAPRHRWRPAGSGHRVHPQGQRWCVWRFARCRPEGVTHAGWRCGVARGAVR